jgi:hypothetical protein
MRVSPAFGTSVAALLNSMTEFHQFHEKKPALGDNLAHELASNSPDLIIAAKRSNTD